jgi:glutamine synthetase
MEADVMHKEAQRPGGPGGTTGMLSLDQLREEAKAGTIDTVVTAFTDMQGRLFGKRIQVEYFLDDVTEHGIEGCNYLLALDMEMDPVPGYEMANWEGGYGDFAIVPDMSTLRRVPWLDCATCRTTTTRPSSPRPGRC